MEPVPLPVRWRPTDASDRDLAEIDAAIELVHRGVARGVSVVGLTVDEQTIGVAVAHGQRLGISVRAVHGTRDGRRTIAIGH